MKLIFAFLPALTLLEAQQQQPQPQPGNPERVSVLATSLTTKMTIRQAMEAAVTGAPSLAAAQDQLQAATAAIRAARLAGVPRAEAIAGVHQATRNGAYGLLLPDQVLAPVAIPTSTTAANAWGATAGVLLSWDVVDFGRRRALQNEASAAKLHAGKQLALSQFELSHTAAEAFLTYLAADQTAKAVSTGVLRAMTLRGVAESESKEGRRPATDATRQQIETTILLNQVIEAEQARDLAKATLNQLTGKQVNPDGAQIVARAPKTVWEKVPLENHPQAREQDAAVGEARAHTKSAAQSSLPTISVEGAAFTRTVASENTTGNWALGVILKVPLTDLRRAAAQREVEAARERSESNRYKKVLRDLDGQLERARALLMGSQRLATSIGDNLAAARAHRDAIFENYRTGKSSIIEVADADRLLTQAEIDSALVNLSIWRAVLAVAAASGDLEPFLRQTD